MCALFQIKVSIGTAHVQCLHTHSWKNVEFPTSHTVKRQPNATCDNNAYMVMWQCQKWSHFIIYRAAFTLMWLGKPLKKRMLRFNWNINLVAVKRQNRCCLKCKAVYCGIDALCLFPRGQWPDNRSNSDWIVFVTGVMTLDRLLQCSVWIPPFCTIDAERFATGIHCSADWLASDWWATPCARLLTTLPNSVCEITTRCWISALHARHFHGLVSSWAPILVEKSTVEKNYRRSWQRQRK